MMGRFRAVLARQAERVGLKAPRPPAAAPEPNPFQGLSAIAQLRLMLDLTGDWRRSGTRRGDLAHLGHRDHADALAKVQHLPLAIANVTGFSWTARDVTNRLRLAKWHVQMLQEPEATTLLAALEQEALTPHQARRVQALKIDCHELRQGPQAALDQARAALAQSPDDEALRRQVLTLLSKTDLVGDRFAAEVQAALPQNPALWTLFVQTALARNQGLWLLPALRAALESRPGDLFVLQSLMDIAWDMQDAAALQQIAGQLAALPHIPLALLRTVQERGAVFAPLAAVEQAARQQVATLTPDAGFDSETCLALLEKVRLLAVLERVGPGEIETGRILAERVLAAFPFLVQARQVLAELLAKQGQIAAAQSQLETVLQDAPHLSAPYSLAFALLAQQAGSEAQMRALLDQRARFVRRYRPNPASPVPPYDVQRYELAYRCNQLPEAVEARSGRPANLLLRQMFAQACPGPDRPLFQEGAGLGATGVVTWLGISDEVRWAQVYGLLARRAASVVISCEPRLESLLRRSFPRIAFVPIRRRWPLLWQDRPVLRSAVRERALAGYVTPAFLGRLAACETILFAEEVTAQMLRHDPAGWKSFVADTAGGYLQPAPEALALWRSRLKPAGRPVIGLIWRSGLVSPARAAHYFALTDFLPLIDAIDADWVALVSPLSAEEESLCRARGIRLLPEVDLFNDMEAVAAVTAALDLVFGASSLPFEMAAAVGTPTLCTALTPDGVARRSHPDLPGKDRMTLQGQIVVPQDPALYRSPELLRADVMAQAQVRIAEILAPPPDGVPMRAPERASP